MNKDDLELLSAYLDEELDPAETRALQQRLAQEPALQAQLDELKANDAALMDTFDAINQDPLPEGLANLLKEAPVEEPGDSGNKRVVALKPRRQTKLNWPAALAASITLALGFMIGQQYESNQRSTPSPLLTQGLQPAKPLTQVLDHTHSGVEVMVDNISVLPELSFVRRDNTFCRQYRLRVGERGVRSIACLEQGQWSNVLSVQANTAKEDNPDYQAAAVGGDVLIHDYIRQYMQGIPLTTEQERARFK